VAEHPRITKPFSDDAWAADARGRKVDAALTQGDVRLTMGGEPTFVSIDDFEARSGTPPPSARRSAQAGRQADPAAARPLRAGRLPALRPGQVVSGRDPAALDLLALLAARRQADLGDPELIAEEAPRTPAQATPERPRPCSAAWPTIWASEPTHGAPAYEDPAEWILKEGNLPDNVTPENSKLRTPRSVHRIARVFARADRRRRAMSCRSSAGNRRRRARAGVRRNGRLRRGHVFLVPGDSPVGYRLPLGSLPHVPPSEYPYVNLRHRSRPTARTRCPTIRPEAGDGPGPDRARQPCRPLHRRRDGRGVEQILGDRRRGAHRDLGRAARRPALRVHAAGGAVEDYLDLSGRAEEAAAEMGLPVHIEGYGPPHDPRMNVIRVAPIPA
jgi:uncharacterized protein (DUF2126 family)